MWWFYLKRVGPLQLGSIFDRYWTHHPALFYGLFFYLGTLSALSWHASELFVLFFLILPALFSAPGTLLLRLGLGMLLAVAAFFYTTTCIIMPPEWADAMLGTATIEIREVTTEIRYMRAFSKMKVDVVSFEASDKSFFAENFVCNLVYKMPQIRPKAQSSYRVLATLEKRQSDWALKVADESPWVEIKPVFSLVEWRVSAKSFFKRLLASNMAPGQVRAFLEGIIIGEFHDSQVSQNLSRFGLQHITVVSGFHFALIAAILAALFRIFLSWRKATSCLIVATTAYLLFVGISASCLRAWVAVTLVLASKLLGEKTNGPNCLGVGLLVTLAIDPAWATNLSFQLSFLATWAILLFYPLCKEAFFLFFPKRTGTYLLSLSFVDQLAFVLLAFFRSSIALVLSVSLLMLPMSLVTFGAFPLLGIVYNCFFPFFISVAVVLLALGFCFLWLKPLASLLIWLSHQVTDVALTHVSSMPGFVDIAIVNPGIGPYLLVTYLCVISFLGIIILETAQEKSATAALPFL